MNFGLIAKMLGLKLTPEQIAQVDAIVPQIPGKLQECVALINTFDARLKALSDGQAKILEVLNGRNNGGGSNPGERSSAPN